MKRAELSCVLDRLARSAGCTDTSPAEIHISAFYRSGSDLPSGYVLAKACAMLLVQLTDDRALIKHVVFAHARRSKNLFPSRAHDRGRPFAEFVGNYLADRGLLATRRITGAAGEIVRRVY